MCISGGMSILLSVPLASEWREVTVKVLYPQIFAGINALKPQGQIKYKSKFRRWRMENSCLFFFIWKQDSWIMDPLSALVKPEEFLPQSSVDFWSGLGKMAYLIFNVSYWLEFMAKEIIIWMSPLLCTSCGRMSKQLSIWGQWKPFNTDVLHPRFIPLSFCTSWYQWGAPQGSNTRHNVMVSWNFGPQHRSPTWTALPTWVLLKSQGCQMCVWGIELPQLVWPLSSAIWKGKDFQILMMRPVHDCHVKKPFPSMVASRTHLHVTAQQIWWAYCLLHVVCKRMKHYYLNHVCLFALSIPACLNCC